MATPAEVDAEITRLRGEITAADERLDQLLKLREHPAVVPVMVFMRHGSRHEEEYDSFGQENDLVRRAYGMLWYGMEANDLSPIGVSVGGDLIDWRELQARYGDLD